MANTTYNIEDNNKHSKLLSSLFCSSSIIVLSILCLLNNLTLDLYTAFTLLKIVIPASVCFWFIGYSMGKILDNEKNETTNKQPYELTNDNEAYAIPSMFADNSADNKNIQDEEI